MFKVAEDKETRQSFPTNQHATSMASIKTSPLSILNQLSQYRDSTSSDEFNFDSEMNEEEGSFKYIEVSPEPTHSNQITMLELQGLIGQIKMLNKRLEVNFEKIRSKHSSQSNENQKIEEIGVENNSCTCLKSCEIY